MKTFTLILFYIFIIFIGPVLFLWGANELLEQAGTAYQIPLNIWTWLAALIVMPKYSGGGS